MSQEPLPAARYYSNFLRAHRRFMTQRPDRAHPPADEQEEVAGELVYQPRSDAAHGAYRICRLRTGITVDDIEANPHVGGVGFRQPMMTLKFDDDCADSRQRYDQPPDEKELDEWVGNPGGPSHIAAPSRFSG